MRPWWNDYVGLPFAWNGHTRAGVSCWGLVCLVQEEVFGRRLPHFDELPVQMGGGGSEQYARLGRMVDLRDVQSGDVLHLRSKTNLHCGIVTEPGFVLHIDEGCGSHVRNYLSDLRFQNRVIGAYRVDPADCTKEPSP